MKLKIAALLLVIALGGCAHAGAIQKSPCACDFHPINKQSFV
jgi:hypothetical protein